MIKETVFKIIVIALFIVTWKTLDYNHKQVMQKLEQIEIKQDSLNQYYYDNKELDKKESETI